MKNISALFFLLLWGCQSANQQSEKIISPSKKYYLTSTVNHSDNSKDDYADVVIHLFTSDGKLKTSLNTNAGDHGKWAVGWDTRKDTVILYSSDIGTFAWEIQTDSLKPVVLTESIRQTADDLRTAKYPERR